MKYVTEYIDRKLCEELGKEIEEEAKNLPFITLMEVCGTHTMAIFRYGIKALLPSNVEMLSGPGCPVCVTPNSYIDKMVAYSKLKDVIIVTFGDMMKVPGSTSSLAKEKIKGRDIRVVYSVNEAIKIAEEERGKKIIFIGVGFETTAPSVAVSVVRAKELGLKNYFVLSGHKLIPPAMRAILQSGETKVNGFILPGHVSTVIGSKPYEFIATEFNVPSVIGGFEASDILQAILMLIRQIKNETPTIEIQYRRSVREEGNTKALEMMWKVFTPCDSRWRGVGVIPGSGLKLKDEYNEFDAEKNIEVKVEEEREHSLCICGEILRGVKTPYDCKLFAKVCTPEDPVGPCMVSTEGTCSAYYKYGR